MISKKEIFYNLAAERTGEIEKLHNSVNFQNLIYHFICDFIDAETHFDNIKSEKIRFEDVEKNQREFESKFESRETANQNVEP